MQSVVILNVFIECRGALHRQAQDVQHMMSVGYSTMVDHLATEVEVEGSNPTILQGTMSLSIMTFSIITRRRREEKN
jgi:hypothetical protein